MNGGGRENGLFGSVTHAEYLKVISSLFRNFFNSYGLFGLV